jgi:hypothetical protein
LAWGRRLKITIYILDSCLQINTLYHLLVGCVFELPHKLAFISWIVFKLSSRLKILEVVIKLVWKILYIPSVKEELKATLNLFWHNRNLVEHWSLFPLFLLFWIVVIHCPFLPCKPNPHHLVSELAIMPLGYLSFLSLMAAQGGRRRRLER